MIGPDKRAWSFRDRALNERAMADYKKIIKQIGRGDLCFNKVYWTPDDKSGVSLYGTSIRSYLISIERQGKDKVTTAFPEDFLEHLMTDPKKFYIWQYPLKPTRFFWVLVDLPDGKHWYQLPKDLQRAMRQHKRAHPRQWWNILCGCYINVPVERYHHHEASLTAGKILRVTLRKKHIHDTRWITRSQFIRPGVTPRGFEHLTANNYQFMRHNFNAHNRSQISQSLHIAVLKHNLRTLFRWQNQAYLLSTAALAVGIGFVLVVSAVALQSLGKII